MRTTLTLDADVAAALKRLRETRGASMKDLVNEALRRGLKEMTTRAKPRKPFRTRSVSLGRLRVGSIDNVAEVLASTSDDLDRLLSAVTPENMHDEIATGPAVGNEVLSDEE